MPLLAHIEKVIEQAWYWEKVVKDVRGVADVRGKVTRPVYSTSNQGVLWRTHCRAY